jgi:hypothetical protein
VPAGAEYRECGLEPDAACPHWYQIPISDEDCDRIIAVTLIDRGIGDDNIPANGAIVDGGGTSPVYSHNPVRGVRESI